jgi:protein-L-isoaspartate O-methyltransferase
VLVAVLTALAGVRRGDRVTGVGTGPRTDAALLAMSGADELVATGARVSVAGAAHDVPAAVRALAPGGRLVAVAADAGAAERVTAAHGLRLQHVEPLGAMVAYSAVLPAEAAGSAPEARADLEQDAEPPAGPRGPGR